MELGPVESLTNFPAPLQGHINMQQWDAILGKLRKAKNETILMSCGGELLCCFLTGFFCIFCCHPIINNAVLDKALESACADVNRTFFSGNPVLHCGNGGTIFLNVHSIPRIQPYPIANADVASQPYSSSSTYSSTYMPPAEQVQAVMAVAVEEDAPARDRNGKYYEEEEQSPYTVEAAPTAPPQNAHTHSGQYIVPQGLPAGATVQVTAPNGAVVSFSLPPGAAAGSVINYNY